MKFKNIKVGDTVYLTKRVKSSLFDNGTPFFVPATVERVTKAQFAANGKRYNKKWGTCIGGGDDVCLEGRDETKEMTEFKATLAVASRISSMAEKIKKIDHTHTHLLEIGSKLEEIEDLLEQK